jgi:hypothetical protein
MNETPIKKQTHNERIGFQNFGPFKRSVLGWNLGEAQSWSIGGSKKKKPFTSSEN